MQADLRLKLETEKITELRHREELLAVRKFFETRWVNEIQKIRNFQTEELQKFKDGKEKNVEAFCNHLFSEYDDKLKKVQKELQYAEEQNRSFLQHKQDWEKVVDAMKSRLEREKRAFVEAKEKEFKLAFESLKENYQKRLAEIQSMGKSGEFSDQEVRMLKEEKLQMITQHQSQLLSLQRELHAKYEKQLTSRLAERDAEAKRLEEACNRRVAEVYELIQEAKCAASHNYRSDSGSNRTATPSSDVTSSDEACSSCQEDMLLRNKHILVNKIHQDGKRVLSLIETVQNPTALEKEARLWLDERNWILNRLKDFMTEPIHDQVNLKKVINDLIEELQKARLDCKLSADEVMELKTTYVQLKHQLNMQQSKVHDLYVHLNQQRAVNSELEALLNGKTAELMDIKKILDNGRVLDNERFSSQLPEKDSNLNSISASYEIDQLRSAPEERSMDKLSLFLPEIGNTPPVHQSPSVMRPVDFDLSIDRDVPERSPSPLPDIESETSGIRRQLAASFSGGRNSDYDSKLHGLYWVCRRSQSHCKALSFQKRYLIGLLRGFQATEKVTLAWLSCMDDGSGGGSVDCRPRGRSLFRAAAFVVIAMLRMRFCVRRWRALARVPSSRVVHSRIRDLFLTYPFLSPTLTPGDGSSSSYSLASSIPASVNENGNHFKENYASDILSSEMRMRQNSPTKSQLTEYVHRLKYLQKELGLDNFR